MIEVFKYTAGDCEEVIKQFKHRVKVSLSAGNISQSCLTVTGHVDVVIVTRERKNVSQLLKRFH